MARPITFLTLFCLSLALVTRPAAAQTVVLHTIEPGDTWIALSWRYGVPEADLRSANLHVNRQRQPAIGRELQIPTTGTVERAGAIGRANDGGLLQTAGRSQIHPWRLALQNGLSSPYRPLLYRPLFIPGDQPLREWPVGFTTLELWPSPSQPGQALALRAQTTIPLTPTVFLNALPFNAVAHQGRFVAVGATGAFFPAGDHDLTIIPPGEPAWTQPWHLNEGQWDYQQLTLTGAAAAIDAASIAAERERLFQLWSQVTPAAQWSGPFQLPVHDYLSISGLYGGRRSYNGGPYRTYHEGVDFAAYAGTPVYAPAVGTVVLAELLTVRGGAVIIDHGLGVYTGFYHMSSVLAVSGEQVAAGQVIGEVGTTGLSTGNHLHWDLLVAQTWVDALAWMNHDMGCWILEGLGTQCDRET